MISEPTRPISSHERDVVLAALKRAAVNPEAERLMHTVDALKVIAHCECGCGSADFETTSPARPTLVADGLARTAKGGLLGVMIWGTADQITGLEVYDMGAGDEDKGLPAPSAVIPWEEGLAAQQGAPADAPASRESPRAFGPRRG